MISNKWYDILKFIAAIALPAVATFYATFATIWGWDNTEQIVASIVAADTLLGVLLGVSTRQYEKSPDVLAGNLHVVKDKNDGQVYTSAAYATQPDNFKDGDIVRMRVKKRSA